ncbi:MAG: hypothetical protein HY721_02960 [Planctomycetes bacterium]|nr:hypothetical protein [Planctomycetota bacterium]
MNAGAVAPDVHQGHLFTYREREPSPDLRLQALAISEIHRLWSFRQRKGFSSVPGLRAMA